MVRLKDWLFRNKDVNTATEQPDDADSARTAERAETLITQGNTLEDSGDFEAALARYREASAIAPGLGRAWVNIGNALQLMGRFDEAIAAQQAAVRLEPENAPAHYNLGALFARIGDSMGAEQELREALRLRPAMTDARIMLSDVLERREDLDQAEAELRVAIVQDPLSPNAAHNLGVLLNRRQRPDAAEDTIIDARSRMPDVASLDIDLASLYIATARAREAEPLFRKAMTAPSTALQAAGGLLFSLNCRDDLDANQVFREHAALGKLFEIQGRNLTSFPNPADPQRPLRIGYVSGDFRRHPVGLFMRPILSRHDRRMFETHCYANHWADDDITTSLKQLASGWHPIAGRDDASVLDMISRDKIDILVDLAGYTTDGRLGVFARRGAPVQVSWLGYLNTTGLATMDYRVCDRYTDPSPESEELHTERLFRLTNSQWCYQPVYAVTPVERPHPESPDAVVFGSFNQYAKLSDTCLALWTSVLKRLPDAQVRVYGVPEGRTRSRFLERIASLGVTPARVSLFGRLDAQQYLAAIADVDIALDSFPYNGATTTLDTLWMGVPLIGLRGARGIARATYSILSSMGTAELIAMSPEDYVDRNVELARDAVRRRKLRSQLRSCLEASPLMDATAFVKNLESGYREMWQAWSLRQAGVQPKNGTASETGNTLDSFESHRPFDVRRSPQAPADLERALVSYRQSVSLKPDDAEAHYNLGTALSAKGNLNDAAASYRTAIALRPDFAAAYNNLGVTLEGQRHWEEAADNYRKAISLSPGNGAAHNNLGNVLNELGQFDAAIASYALAIELDESAVFKANFVQCIKNHTFTEATARIRNFAARAISEPWAHKSALTKVGISLLKTDRNIGELIDRASHSWPTRMTERELFGPSGPTILSNDVLLRALLENAPVTDVAMERFLTMARQVVLDQALSAEIEPDAARNGEAFYCALARQCFINEYVFSHTEPELARATVLRERLITALQSGSDVPARWVVAAAAYFPLHSIPGAEALLARAFPEAMAKLLAQQIAEPLEERRDRAAIPRLTKVGAGVSSTVQRQYEENPYPRWVKLPPCDPVLIDDYLRQQFPAMPFEPLGKGGDIDILVAGCGTGSEAIFAAQQFPASRILAIDLSLTSLCYARRKTRENGAGNIAYAQADIMKLPSIGQTFDVISSSGVLHHLADPLAGLRELVSLLRPGGFMRLGIYSQIARQAVVAARQFIAERRYPPTSDGIRRCRQDLMDSEEPFDKVIKSSDFFSTSECRDLLFHVQEHQFTVPQVKDALQRAGLNFIGFSVGPRVVKEFAARFPEDTARTNLDNWDRLEREFPDMFAGMYDFWAQKPHAT